MFKLLKTRMTATPASAAPIDADRRHNRPVITRDEMTALFAQELGLGGATALAV